MKEINLINSNKKFQIDDEDYGKIIIYNWYLSDRLSIRASMDNKMIILSKFLLKTGNLVDHIDRNPFNNQKENLRIANKSLNNANSFYTSNTSGYKGVSWSKQNKKWMVQITVNKQKITIGFFNNVLDAAKAYNEAALKHFGEFAWINHI